MRDVEFSSPNVNLHPSYTIRKTRCQKQRVFSIGQCDFRPECLNFSITSDVFNKDGSIQLDCLIERGKSFTEDSSRWSDLTTKSSVSPIRECRHISRHGHCSDAGSIRHVMPSQTCKKSSSDCRSVPLPPSCFLHGYPYPWPTKAA